MRRRAIRKWWHRHVRRHRIQDQIFLSDVPSPWPDWDSEPLCQVWATRCLEPECFWLLIETSREHSYIHGDL